MNIATKNAVQNPESLNPFTIFATSIIMSALSANAKKPSEMRVSGKVSQNKIGLMSALTRPSNNADTSSAEWLLNLSPLKIKLATHKDKLMMPQ